jgi:hypothetical protein
MRGSRNSKRGAIPIEKTNNKKKNTLKPKEKTKNSTDMEIDATPEEESIHNDGESEDTMSHGNFRLNTFFITLKIEMNPSTTFLLDLRDKYCTILDTLLEADKKLILRTADPNHSGKDIKKTEDIPRKMTSMIKYFYTTNKAPKKDKGQIWITARISSDESFEDICTATSYDLADENITLMKKRLQAFKTVQPAYFQFLDNRCEPNDIIAQITKDLDNDIVFTLLNKKPWEGYGKSKHTNTNTRKDFLSKCLHIECETTDSDLLMYDIRKWIKSGLALKSFGPHIKIITELSNQSPTQQVDRTIRMNSHGRRFQASIDMVELQGLTEPNGTIGMKDTEGTILLHTIRDLIIQHMPNNEQIFLSVSKKWGSPMWQATYIKTRKKEAEDFASCPCAWLHQKVLGTEQKTLFKHFTPESVKETLTSEWDEATSRIITPSEKSAISEEEAVKNISWLINIDELDDDSIESKITFTDGVHFNFNDEVSVNTTRISGTDSLPSPLTQNDNPRSPITSVLKSSSSTSVTSEMTADSRIKSLESGMEQILNFLKTSTTNNSPKVNTLKDNEVLPPSSLKGGDGE